MSEATQHMSSRNLWGAAFEFSSGLGETKRRREVMNLHFLHQHHSNSVALRVGHHFVDSHIPKVLVVNSIVANWATPPVLVSESQIMQNTHKAVNMTAAGDSRCDWLAQTNRAVLLLRVGDNLSE